MSEHRPTARIMIADDHQLLADACKSLLEPEFLVVGTVADGLHVEDAVVELKPNIVLMNTYMPRLNGLGMPESRLRIKTPGSS